MSSEGTSNKIAKRKIHPGILQLGNTDCSSKSIPCRAVIGKSGKKCNREAKAGTFFCGYHRNAKENGLEIVDAEELPDDELTDPELQQRHANSDPDSSTAGGNYSGSQICPRKIVATASVAVRSSRIEGPKLTTDAAQFEKPLGPLD